MWKEGIVCRSDVLLGLPEFIDSAGGNSDRLIREAGISPADLKGKEKFVCWLALQRLLANAARELNLPDLGLRWAEGHKLPLNNFGPLVVLLIVSKDVRSFLDSWIEYDRIHTSGSYSQVVEGEAYGLPDGTARGIVRYSPATPDSRQLKETCISVFYQMFHNLAGLPDPVSRVGFPHKPMASMDVYEKHFKCPIEFNAAYTYIDFSSSILDKKMGPTFNPGKKMFASHIEKKLRKSPTGETGFSAQVGLILPHVLGLGNSDAETVAETLGVSLRKMQRLLKDEGNTYSEVLDDVRHNMARELLQDSEISIARIAELLDYKSSIALANACKRWTGQTPRAYRTASRAIHAAA